MFTGKVARWQYATESIVKLLFNVTEWNVLHNFDKNISNCKQTHLFLMNLKRNLNRIKNKNKLDDKKIIQIHNYNVLQ